MTASLRPQRVLQRLTAHTPACSAATPRTTRGLVTLTTVSSFNQHSCILCQHRIRPTPASGSSTFSIIPQQRQRTFTTTLRASNSSPSSSPPPSSPLDALNPSTHYTLFPSTLPSGPPPTGPFEIRAADLRREFLLLQSTTHPDKYPPGPVKQRAEALSARLNEAYRTLSNPLLRAQYILHQYHGIDLTADDGENHRQALDPELLMEVMDVQEAIEEVGAGPGAEERIAEIKEENDARIRECVEAVGKAFDSGDVEGARGETVRLKFWASVAEGLREWEPGTGGIRLVH
ncbi:HSCB C-terminal oligomerization domain-containing protein [Aspergillus egyptiacus]|nr:HSCB C-terminal oligomerization domain-containing protein [Aspergillus egyptiacus]